jgi:arsenate reductase
MGITIYHNPKCGKSRETLALLRERGIEPAIVEYLKTPPSAAELARILKRMGKRPADVVRTKDAREAGVDPGSLSDAQLIAAIVAQPQMLERPIVVNGDRAALGRPPENVLAILPG